MALRTRIVLTLTALALLLPSSALAAGWTGFASLPTTGGTVTGLKFATDSAGNEAALWIEPVAGGPYKVLAAVRHPGGAWSSVQTLDASSTSLPLIDLAVDPAGNFIAAYTRPATRVVLSNYLPAGQTTFGGAEAVGGAAAATINSIAVALSPTGIAYEVTGVATGGANAANTRPPGAGSKWSAMSVTGLPTTSGTLMDMTVTSNGVPTVVDNPAAGGQPRHTRWNAAGPSWVTINTPTGITNMTGSVKIVPDANNQTTTIFNVANTATQIVTQSCPVGVTALTSCTPRQTWGNGNFTFAVNQSLAVDPATGNAIATWTENSNIMVSRRTGPTGTWDPFSTLTQGQTPAAAIDSSGNVVHVYADGNNRMQFLFAATGAALAPPATPVTDPAQSWLSPVLGTDGSGNTYGVWVSKVGTAAQSAVYDTVPPTTPAITGAASALVGDTVALAASATDTWGVQGYSWDFGDGSTASGPSASHAYAAPGTYLARVTATDNAGNQSSQTQTVAIAAQPTQQQTFTRPPLARPIAGKNVNLEPVGGTVLVEVPGSATFVPLVEPQQVRDGSIIDARNGKVRITIDNGKGGFDTADFFGGIFQFFQPKVKKGQTWYANLYLYGGSFKGCPAAPKNPKIALASGRAKKKAGSSKSVRHLWGDGHGAFRTVGRYASATVRGTTWLTDDRCDGTLVKVTNGLIGVRDFVLNKTLTLRKSKQYLAHPKAKSAKKAKTQSKKR